MSRPPPSNGSAAALLLQQRAAERPFPLLVDMGSGPEADHALWFMAEGIVSHAIALDAQPHTVSSTPRFQAMRGDFDASALGVLFDLRDDSEEPPYSWGAVWMCHALEHSRRPVDALYGIARLSEKLFDGCLMAVTVPPLKREIVGGHLNLYNAGLLLYQMVRAGIDCSQASIRTYGYNISVVVPFHRLVALPELLNDNGDIERLAHLFPAPYNTQGFNGDIKEHNWQ